MERSNTFQIVIIGIFVALVILGFLAFSGHLPLPTGSQDVNYGTVTLWGTLPKAAVDKVIGDNLSTDTHIKITYVEKSQATFNSDFIEALASGNGPDLILLSQDNILRNLDKISLIPYTTLSERDFMNTFLPEAQMFLQPQGIAAMPITIDPIVMYWNRDIFSNALVVTPPSLWTQFYDLVPKITVHDSSGNITQSLVSFGEYRNVSNAKEIVSLLLMQAGSPIVLNQNGSLSADLVVAGSAGAQDPVTSALRFFTEFSKPDQAAYSWNRALPLSRTMFESGNLAIYFGYASEYQSIMAKNPHLNFDVALVPQATQTGQTPGQSLTKLTFGRVEGAAIVKASKNQQGALYAAMALSGKNVVADMSTTLGLPPVRSDLITTPPQDPVQTIFYNSAIISRGWYDPSPDDTDALFTSMFDGLSSGNTLLSNAIATAQTGLGKLLEPYRK